MNTDIIVVTIGRVLALTLAVFATTPAARAAVHCATTPIELQQALSAAAASPADDEIRIREGIYTPQSPFVYASDNAGWLNITGGWVQEGDTNCARQEGNAASTVLDGAGQRQVLRVFHNMTTAPVIVPRYLISNLMLANGFADGFERGGGLSIHSGAAHYIEFFLDNLVVANNSGYFSGGINLYLANGYARVTNSLFVGNDSPSGPTAHFAATVLASPATHALTIANSTFADGTCQPQDYRGCGVNVGLGGSARLDVMNTLFHNNPVSDITIEGLGHIGLGNGTAHFEASHIPVHSGTLTPTIVNALSGDPSYVDAANGNFRLRDDSPFINRGTGVPPFYNVFGWDVDGELRVRFGTTDPGAYENQTWDFLFADGFQ